MTRPVRTDFIARDKTSAVVDKISGKTEGMGNKLLAVGKKLAIGFAAAGTALAVAAPKILATAGQLEQMGKKAETVFGKQLPMVEKWSKKSAAAMGLTSRQLTGLTANFGDLLIPMGFGRKEAAKMSTSVVGLAGALSKWSGGQKTAEEVAQSLAKAMLGEREELKGLGISISEADVQQRLLKKGQDELKGSALQQAKAIATQELIFEKSTDAQAAFAKGGGDLLDVKNRLTAKLKDFGETLLTKATPALKGLADFAINKAVPALESLGGKVKDAWDKLKLKLPKVDWSKLGAGIKKAASGWGKDIVGGFKTAIDTGDWGPFGKSLGKAINDALTKMGDLSIGFAKWVGGIDWVEIGKKIGGKAIGFAIGFISGLGDELFSAEFWKKHWLDVIVAVLSAVGVGKILGVLGKLFTKLKIFPFLAKMFGKADDMANIIWKPFMKALRFVGRNFLKGFRQIFPNFAKGFGGFWLQVNTWIGVRALQLGAWALRMIDKFIGGIFRGLGKGTGLVVKGIGRLIGFMLKPWAMAGKWLFKHGQRLIRGFQRGVGIVASRLGAWLKDKIWKPIARVLDRVKDNFSRGVRKIGEIWNRLRDKTRRPVNFMIDVVYNKGIRRLWNTINNLWGGKDLKPIKFARGGVLPGFAPGRDSVPAVLSPGEGILRPEVVRQLGAETINAWNKAARAGKPIHAFADGGIVGTLKSIGSGIMSLFTNPGKVLRRLFAGPLEKMNRFRDTAFGRGIARIPRLIVSKLIGKAKGLLDGGLGFLGSSQSQSVRAIMAVARTFDPGARLTSGVRNTPDYHGRGLAADIVGNMPRIARGFYKISGRLLELIHAGAGGFFVKNGRRVGPGFYGRATVNDHFDHVHVAARKDALAGLYDKGGVLPPGVSMAVNRTGRPEAVLTGAQWAALLNALTQPTVFEFRGDGTRLADVILMLLKQAAVKRVGKKGSLQKAVMGVGA